MSILIKGMEMPTNCCQCPVNMEVCKRGYEYLLAHPELYDKRADDCPLVHIPPHGRLVSMDEIEERIDSCCDYIDCSKTMCNECAVQIVMNKVFDAPTIIPASEEGER